jgi:AraC-like DNA-binding protein
MTPRDSPVARATGAIMYVLSAGRGGSWTFDGDGTARMTVLRDRPDVRDARTHSRRVVDTVTHSTEEYSSLVSQTFAPLAVTPLRDAPFQARFRRSRFSSVTVAHMICSPSHIDHPADGDDSIRLIKVMLQIQGTGVLTQDNNSTVTAPGTMVAYDTSLPYELAFEDDYRSIVLGIPFAAWGGRASLIAESTMKTIRAAAGIGPLVSTMLTSAGSESPQGESPGHSLFADALVSLVAAAFIGEGTPDDDLATAFHERVLAYCEANLTDPNLSLHTVAGSMYVSVSYLQKRMNSAGIALATWIRRRRVERIVEDLRRPDLAHLTTTAIAQAWGVRDTAHLSRVLRAHVGMTADEVRRSLGAVNLVAS